MGIDSRKFPPLPDNIMETLKVDTDKKIFALTQISLGKRVSMGDAGKPHKRTFYDPSPKQKVMAKEILDTLLGKESFVKKPVQAQKPKFQNDRGFRKMRY